MPEPEVDDLDHAILRLLHEDARRTYADMAERVGLSTAATKRRVDRMLDSGGLRGGSRETTAAASDPARGHLFLLTGS